MQSFQFDRSKLDALCQAYHVRSLSLFGSTLRGEQTKDSDLDLLVEFDPDHKTGFFELVTLERALGTLFQRKVDLNTAGFLNRAFRSDVVQHAEPIYVG